VDVRTQPAFCTGKRVVLPIEAIFTPGLNFERNYDLTPDGKQFVVVAAATSPSRDSNRSSPQQIDVVLNWLEELKARVPTK